MPLHSTDFASIPIIDFQKSLDPTTKPQFLEELRQAAASVGFLYFQNPPIPTIGAISGYAKRLFTIPQEEKDKIDLGNVPHFLGYTRPGAEHTKGKMDDREFFDFGTPCECPWEEGKPEYLKLWGPSQWPSDEVLPGFRACAEKYFSELTDWSFIILGLLEEAFFLPKDVLSTFFLERSKHLHRSKFALYPANGDQGVGSHYDHTFLSLLLQVQGERGLQAQNIAGRWIDVVPVPNTIVCNFGRPLEFITHGLIRAISHRVVNPPVGTTPRISISWFFHPHLDVDLAKKVIDVSAEFLQLKEERGEEMADITDLVGYDAGPSGWVWCESKVKGRAHIMERFYPVTIKRLFPSGIPDDLRTSVTPFIRSSLATA